MGILFVPFITLFLLIIRNLAGAAPEDQTLAAADNDFAFNLLKQLAKNQPAKNIFISPYSAATVLQMVGSGAAGQTRIEMQKVLGTTGLSDDAIARLIKKSRCRSRTSTQMSFSQPPMRFGIGRARR